VVNAAIGKPIRGRGLSACDSEIERRLDGKSGLHSTWRSPWPTARRFPNRRSDGFRQAFNLASVIAAVGGYGSRGYLHRTNNPRHCWRTHMQLVENLGWKCFYLRPKAPDTRGAVAMVIEGGRMQVFARYEKYYGVHPVWAHRFTPACYLMVQLCVGR